MKNETQNVCNSVSLVMIQKKDLTQLLEICKIRHLAPTKHQICLWGTWILGKQVCGPLKQ